MRASPGSARYGVCSTNRTVSNDEECNVSLEAVSVFANCSEASTAVICKDPFQFSFMDSSDVCYDTLMCRAYGCSLSQLSGVDHDFDWRSRWKQVIYHSGNHYILPGGPIGRRYVDLLAEEVTHLAGGHFPPERVLVFSSVILQRDRMVRKGADIHRLLERRIELWRQNNFDLLVQEAERCDKALCRTRHSAVDEDSIIRVFTRLMLRGKVKSAVRWATERTRGIVLSPSDMLDGSTTVMDALRQKHPGPCPPDSTTLLKSDSLPQLADVEITGGHILCAARRIQGVLGLVVVMPVIGMMLCCVMVLIVHACVMLLLLLLGGWLTLLLHGMMFVL